MLSGAIIQKAAERRSTPVSQHFFSLILYTGPFLNMNIFHTRYEDALNITQKPITKQGQEQMLSFDILARQKRTKY